MEFYDYCYDLANELSIYMEKEYIDYEFKLIYKYFEIYYNYMDNYINNINQEIIKLEKSIQDLLKNKYDIFINNYSKYISNFVTYDYIDRYKYNHSQCLKYENMELNDILKEDLKNSNYQKELIDNIFNNCTFNVNEFIFIDENGTDCLNLFNLTANEKINFIETKHYLICDENNFYNLTMTIFNKFEDSYKVNLDKSINK